MTSESRLWEKKLCAHLSTFNWILVIYASWAEQPTTDREPAIMILSIIV